MGRWRGGRETGHQSLRHPGRSKGLLADLPGCCDQSYLSGMGLARDTLGTTAPVWVPGPGTQARTGRPSASEPGRHSLKEVRVKAKY